MTSPAAPPVFSSRRIHHLRILIAAILVILTAQGWTGDVVNIFIAPASGTQPAQSFAGFFQAIETLPGAFPLLFWHAFEGVFLIAFSIAILVLSFKWSMKKSVRISSILALFFVLAAAFGGYLFVLSGFNNGGNSAQMGGSFIGVYAFYFLELYFSK